MRMAAVVVSNPIRQLLHDGLCIGQIVQIHVISFDRFEQTFAAKYPKAVQCLQKDKDELLAFYEFPAMHWQSLRTTNPIESTFSTIRHRTKRAKGCLSRDGMLQMMFKLGQCAEQNWRRLRGFEDLNKVITGVKFKDGVEIKQNAA